MYMRKATLEKQRASNKAMTGEQIIAARVDGNQAAGS